MEKLLQDLESLGVFIPDNLSDEQLLRHAKQLNPWTVTIIPSGSSFIATTRAARFAPDAPEQELMDAVAYLDTTAHGAALNLLYEQLEAGKYSLSAVGYKLHAQQRNH